MEKQLTAVDYLVEQFAEILGQSIKKTMAAEIEQAKALEKQQIIDAVDYGMAESVRERYSDKKLTLKCKGDAEQYYNNNFKQ